LARNWRSSQSRLASKYHPWSGIRIVSLGVLANDRFAPEEAVPRQSDIERNKVSPAHAHPDLEQTAYIPEGEAIVEIGSKEHHVRAGDLLYFPARVFDSIKVLSERVKLLVIYSPPYGENPAKLIKSREYGSITGGGCRLGGSRQGGPVRHTVQIADKPRQPGC
jgi:quercetin dioxygenase-like cupin family protein